MRLEGRDRELVKFKLGYLFLKSSTHGGMRSPIGKGGHVCTIPRSWRCEGVEDCRTESIHDLQPLIVSALSHQATSFSCHCSRVPARHDHDLVFRRDLPASPATNDAPEALSAIAVLDQYVGVNCSRTTLESNDIHSSAETAEGTCSWGVSTERWVNTRKARPPGLAQQITGHTAQLPSNPTPRAPSDAHVRVRYRASQGCDDPTAAPVVLAGRKREQSHVVCSQPVHGASMGS